MAEPRPRTELSGELITARVPRIMRFMAQVIEAANAGDNGYQLDAPTDLPMDEATFVATTMLVTDMAEAAGLTPDQLRSQAATIEANVAGQ
jgi:hypothetical protein